MTYTCLTRNRQNGTERMDHMKRVGFLTSGGDCQALNATMRGVAKGLYQIYQDEVEIIGFEDGYKGLMYANYRMMKRSDFSTSMFIVSKRSYAVRLSDGSFYRIPKDFIAIDNTGYKG